MKSVHLPEQMLCDFTFRVSSRGRLAEVWLNPIWLENRGSALDKRQLEGKRTADFLRAGFRSNMAYLRDGLRTGGVERFSLPVKLPGLGAAWLELVCAAEGGANCPGRTFRVAGRDVSSLRLDHQASRGQNLRLRRWADMHQRMLDALPVLVAQVGANFRYEACNAASAAWFALQPDEVTGRAVAEIVGQGTFEQLLPHLERALAGRGSALDECYDMPGLPLRYVHTITLPRYGVGGEADGIHLLSFDDTTRTRLLQAREKQFAQFQSTAHMESVGRLAAGVAHGFNNLLPGILGPAELLLGESNLPEGAREHLHMVCDHASQASALCRDMLAYAGGGRTVVRPLDLADVIAAGCDQIQAALKPGILLHVDVADSLPMVEADANQVLQALLNLCRNASDAVGETGNVWLSCSHTEGWVALEVRDDGHGFDPAQAPKLTEPFFTTRSPGRGLGLAAVAGIARSHGADLALLSSGAKGATIRLCFPCGDDRAASVTARALPARQEGANTVLLVDDNVTIRKLGARILKSAGFEVVVAKDGAVALKHLALAGDEVCGVVLDMVMPILGGEEALSGLRLLFPELPVPLSSGYADDGKVERITAADGYVAFLQKPYRPRALLDGLAELGVMARPPDQAAVI